MYNAAQTTGGTALAATGFAFAHYALAAWVLVLAGVILLSLTFRARKGRHQATSRFLPGANGRDRTGRMR
jgi:hypothetical protein